MFTFFFCMTTVAATDFFHETFEDRTKWVDSTTRTDEDKMASMILTDDNQMKTGEKARFYTMFARMDQPVEQQARDFVLEYTVQLENTDFKCGGAYLKLLETDDELSTLNHETPYKLMFGPDFSCDSNSKVHAIINETQWSILPSASVLSDGLEHTFTLVLRPDNSFSYYVDHEEVNDGDIEDFWPLLEPKQIPDPTISKPTDWPSPTILDVNHIKPDGYDDIPQTVVDLGAVQPADWDDGLWEPPTIPNADYKGPWRQRSIPNPNYDGPWVHPQIPNTNYVPNLSIYNQMSGANVIGFELWNFDSGILFDNIIVSDDSSHLKQTEM